MLYMQSQALVSGHIATHMTSVKYTEVEVLGAGH